MSDEWNQAKSSDRWPGRRPAWTFNLIAVSEKHGVLPSMSRPANPYDNATCESFIKTLKHEEIRYLQVEDLETLRSQLQEFIETYYNRRRLHSALDYRSPEQFEQTQAASTPAGSLQAARLSFLRHGAIYQCNGEQPGKEPNHSPTHCVDESPVWLFLGGLLSSRARLRFTSRGR